MLNWLRTLHRIICNYDWEIGRLRDRLEAEQGKRKQLEALLRERTSIAVDVGFKDACYVIVVGRYKGADYVQTFSINTPDMASLIEQLKQMERYGEVKRVDAPPQFRAVFQREFDL